MVADEPQAVGADGDRGIGTDVAHTVQGGDCSAGAGRVRAVGHLEVVVGTVVVADEPQAVGADGSRGIGTDVVRAVQGCSGSAGAGGVVAVGQSYNRKLWMS
jgi:hypothetical protein